MASREAKAACKKRKQRIQEMGPREGYSQCTQKLSARKRGVQKVDKVRACGEKLPESCAGVQTSFINEGNLKGVHRGLCGRARMISQTNKKRQKTKMNAGRVSRTPAGLGVLKGFYLRGFS
jgi:hypothetical protein